MQIFDIVVRGARGHTHGGGSGPPLTGSRRPRPWGRSSPIASRPRTTVSGRRRGGRVPSCGERIRIEGRVTDWDVLSAPSSRLAGRRGRRLMRIQRTAGRKRTPASSASAAARPTGPDGAHRFASALRPCGARWRDAGAAHQRDSTRARAAETHQYHPVYHFPDAGRPRTILVLALVPDDAGYCRGRRRDETYRFDIRL